ncbi:MAG: SUMF1/EgtB/PvdO family nonheme iron enzyme [Chitinivibrionales bacterium]|nr:SUMF1/EgtB/PvdO family nonheme iron enzyme [Chitinivibrionales bacterium]MBD3394203.1 SUMF1/EgtB/PvdO family nonheme iron enzyme [Chitinivibrionales bacterium]
MNTRFSIVPRTAVAGMCLLFLACCRDFPPVGSDRVTISVAPDGQGTVSMIPPDSSVQPGAVVVLSAAPDSGNVFVGWFGDTQSTENPLVIVARRSMSIEGRFAARPDAMILVPARDSVFEMGSNSGPAVAGIEDPVHEVSFTYDFHMDPFEITQKHYRDLMGHDPAAAGGYVDAGDSIPVFDITWYEAVLFCNARSKDEGYDTVYSYTACCADDQSCPYVLENLTIHYDRFGFRLPTEAEWEYACRAGSAADFYWGDSPGDAATYAWYFDNAANRAHAVGLKQPNAFGLYDMSGNVAEWVNDWLGAYDDSLAVNPVGPAHLALEEFESSWERPVRGGAFDVGTAYLRASARRLGPYETPAKVRMHEIGFRTVLGAFFVPDSAGPVVDTVPDSLSVTRTAEKSDFVSFVGTANVKLVFVQRTTARTRLYAVDFMRADIAPFVLDDSLSFHPTISPDGSRIAYSTQGVGRSSPSRVIVRPFDPAGQNALATSASRKAYIPRWWTDSASADTFLVYSDGASINSSAGWHNEKTYKHAITGMSFDGDAHVLWDDGSYHGGLSSDGRFLATGYTAARLVDLRLGDTTLLYFRAPYNGRDDNPQTCNVSISPSVEFTDHVLLLDFGYSKTSSVVGSSYGLHEIIFQCNSKLLSDEHVVSWYETPSGFDSWNHVEYTNHPDFAVAVAQGRTTDADDRVYLINLKTSAYLPVARGRGLRDPWLWIDPAEVAELPDPYADFAKYDLPIQCTGQDILGKKLKLMWKYRDEIDAVFFGSSPAYHGVNPAFVSSVRMLSMATKGSDPFTSVTVARNYALPHLDNLKVIGMALDPGFLDRDFTEEPPFMTGLYDSKGYAFDSGNDFWRTALPGEIKSKISAFDSSSWTGYDTLGFLQRRYTGESWGSAPLEQGDYSLSDSIVAENLVSVEALADSASARAIHLLVVNFPQSPAYANTSHMGRYGPSWTTYAQIVSRLETLESQNSYFHFYDAHAGGQHDYTAGDAFDSNHLNYTGATRLSARIDSVLQTFLP